MDNQFKLHFSESEGGETIPYKSLFGFNNKSLIKHYDGETGSTALPIWNSFEGMKFDGSYTIKGHHDVANIMKGLESKTVELGFAVHVNEKQEALIQFLSMGGKGGTVIDASLILAGAKLHDSKQIFLVHNHPSGNLTPSKEDIHLTGKIKNAFENLNIEVSHVIINTYKKEYTFLDDSIYSFHDRGNSDRSKTYKAYAFDEMDILREPLVFNVSQHRDVVPLIQQIRFSAAPKHGFLALASNNSVTANFLVNDFSLKSVTDIIAPLPAVRGIIAYGNTRQEEEINALRENIKHLGYDLLDYVQVNSNGNGVKGAYLSYETEGILRDIQEKYKTNDIKLSKKIERPWETNNINEDSVRKFTR